MGSQSIRTTLTLSQAVRQCSLERQISRGFADLAIRTQETRPPPISSRKPVPKGWSPGQAIKQNRINTNLRSIPIYPRLKSTAFKCKDPIRQFESEQIKLLDPTGQRTKLFSKDNPERVKAGDVLLVRLKSGEPFHGVCLSVRQIHNQVDWAILLRDHVTRIPVEMWFKIYSPNVEGIEIVQRPAKRPRRARLYYMRQPKHDMGSVEGIVRQYIRSRSGGSQLKKKGKR